MLLLFRWRQNQPKTKKDFPILLLFCCLLEKRPGSEICYLRAFSFADNSNMNHRYTYEMGDKIYLIQSLMTTNDDFTKFSVYDGHTLVCYIHLPSQSEENDYEEEIKIILKSHLKEFSFN